MSNYSVTHLSGCISVFSIFLLYLYFHKDLGIGLPCICKISSYHSYHKEHKEMLLASQDQVGIHVGEIMNMVCPE